MSSETRDSNTPATTSSNAVGPRQAATPVDLQIVGGGLAGLVAANLAVDAGLSVRLIEKQRSLGGRAGSSAHSGFTLNQGPHALYLSGQLNSALKRFGITPKGTPPLLKAAVGTIGDKTDLLPQGPGSLLRTSLLPPRGKRHLAAIMARLPRMKPEPVASTTVTEWIRSLTDVAELRVLLGGLVNLSTYNSAADLTSADAALAQTKMVMSDGVIYLDDGWQAMVEALQHRLENHQPNATPLAARFERVTGSALEVTDEGPLQLVHTAEAIYPGANLLLALGSPAATDRVLGAALSGPGPGPLTSKAGPPVQAAVMDLGLRSDPAVSVHLGLDRGLYYAKHSGADGLAPAGQAIVSLARYVPPGDDLPVEETKALLLGHAHAVGVKNEDIVMTRYLHKLTVTWGMPLASQGGLAGRPSHALADWPGVHIAGDWVGDRGLLADASAASAVDAIAAIVADPTRRIGTAATMASLAGTFSRSAQPGPSAEPWPSSATVTS